MITLSDRTYWITGFIVAIGITGQWLEGPWPMLTSQLWILPTALLIAAVFAERAALAAMQISLIRKTPSEVYLGECFSTDLVVTNHDRRPVHIQCQPSYPASFSAEAGIRRYDAPRAGTVSDRLEILPVQLGKSGLGDIHVKVRGFMGLVWWYRRISDGAVVKIVPRSMTTTARTRGERLAGVRNARQPIQGGMEFLLHREYQQGDPLQIVDWKATARSHDLMVRVMTRDQRMELVVLLDCGRTSQLQVGPLSQLHHNVNIVAHLAELAVKHGDHVACITYADRPLAMMPPGSGINGLRRTRAILRDARSLGSESNILAAALQARRLLGHRALVVVLTDLSTGDDASQFSRAVRLLSARHLVVIASIDDTEIEAMSWTGASHWLDPYRNFAAAEYCRQRELTKLKLNQQGASVISAAADTLDSKLMDYYRELRQRIAV
ncbi:MAG: DUF58 domain-containing protein [Gammaproteobacteria bacterium]